LAIVPRERRPALLAAVANGIVLYSEDEGRTWVLSGSPSLQEVGGCCLAVDDKAPGVLYLGTAREGVYRGDGSSTRPWGMFPFAVAGVALLTAAGVYVWLKRLRKHRSVEIVDDDWEAWEESIGRQLISENRVRPEALTTIPSPMRLLAMERYVMTHRDQDLVLREDPPLIEPVSYLKLQQFSHNWSSLAERLDTFKAAAPIASRITEQLCDLVGFASLEYRSFRSLVGYAVRAPTLRLNIPSRFLIVFVLERHLGPQTIANVRDLMRVLDVTAFFAYLVVVDDEPERRERARELRRHVRGGAEDLIVLDRHDLYSLFLARDAEQRLVDLTLDQVDLTVVSPYVISGPVPENMFFGRAYELKTIMRTVRDHSFAIMGGRKIGKTSVLNKVHRLMEQTSGYASYYLDCQYVTSYEGFFNALSYECWLPVESAAPDVMRRVVLRLRRRHEGQLVLLLDEVDRLLQFDETQGARLFLVFRALSQEGLCRFVFCGERQLNKALHNADSPLFNFCSTIYLTYLAPRDASRMIEEPMATMGVTFADSDSLLRGIIQLSSCHPNIVQYICRILVSQVNARQERIVRVEDLAKVRASDEFKDFFIEVTWGNATLLERLISVLMVGEAGFGLSDVMERLASHGCETSPRDLDLALDDLTLFSILQKQGDRYTYANRAFPALLSASDLAESSAEGMVESFRERRQIGST